MLLGDSALFIIKDKRQVDVRILQNNSHSTYIKFIRHDYFDVSVINFHLAAMVDKHGEFRTGHISTRNSRFAG